MYYCITKIRRCPNSNKSTKGIVDFQKCLVQCVCYTHKNRLLFPVSPRINISTSFSVSMVVHKCKIMSMKQIDTMEVIIYYSKFDRDHFLKSRYLYRPPSKSNKLAISEKPVICCYTAMKNQISIVIHFWEIWAKLIPVPKMMVTKKPPAKNSNWRAINNQSNDSLAFQQHASGQFSAIKHWLLVVFDLRTPPPPSVILQL